LEIGKVNIEKGDIKKGRDLLLRAAKEKQGYNYAVNEARRILTQISFLH
jgi:hypothetical protein